jgi:acyl phosphate:glycerol-3-phosphate acyltransferase
MNIEIINVIGIILAYLIGSIPTSVWIGRVFYGIDVRKFGSGNAGATNTIRVLGTLPGIIVLVFDAFKGWGAVSMAVFFGTNFHFYFQYVNYELVLGLAVLLGHVFPIYVGFKGGKGIATLTGIIIALYPFAFLVALGLFLLVFLFTRYVSLGSICTAVSFPFIVIFVFNITLPSLIIFACMIAVFVPLTHKKNIKRLLNGSESKLYFNKKHEKEKEK